MIQGISFRPALVLACGDAGLDAARSAALRLWNAQPTLAQAVAVGVPEVVRKTRQVRWRCGTLTDELGQPFSPQRAKGPVSLAELVAQASSAAVRAQLRRMGFQVEEGIDLFVLSKKDGLTELIRPDAFDQSRFADCVAVVIDDRCNGELSKEHFDLAGTLDAIPSATHYDVVLTCQDEAQAAWTQDHVARMAGALIAALVVCGVFQRTSVFGSYQPGTVYSVGVGAFVARDTLQRDETLWNVAQDILETWLEAPAAKEPEVPPTLQELTRTRLGTRLWNQMAVAARGLVVDREALYREAEADEELDADERMIVALANVDARLRGKPFKDAVEGVREELEKGIGPFQSALDLTMAAALRLTEAKRGLRETLDKFSEWAGRERASRIWRSRLGWLRRLLRFMLSPFRGRRPLELSNTLARLREASWERPHPVALGLRNAVMVAAAAWLALVSRSLIASQLGQDWIDAGSGWPDGIWALVLLAVTGILSLFLTAAGLFLAQRKVAGRIEQACRDIEQRLKRDAKDALEALLDNFYATCQQRIEQARERTEFWDEGMKEVKDVVRSLAVQSGDGDLYHWEFPQTLGYQSTEVPDARQIREAAASFATSDLDTSELWPALDHTAFLKRLRSRAIQEAPQGGSEEVWTPATCREAVKALADTVRPLARTTLPAAKGGRRAVVLVPGSELASAEMSLPLGTPGAVLATADRTRVSLLVVQPFVGSAPNP